MCCRKRSRSEFERDTDFGLPKPKVAKTAEVGFNRPSFARASVVSAKEQVNLHPEMYPFSLTGAPREVAEKNLAMPHRMSFFDMKRSVEKHYSGRESDEDFKRWTDRFIEAGKERIATTKSELVTAPRNDIPKINRQLKGMEQSQHRFTKTRDAVLAGGDSTGKFAREKEFLSKANSFHANVPDFGPHFGVNHPVQEGPHLHVAPPSTETLNAFKPRPLSPMSRQVRGMSPSRLSRYPVTKAHDLITTSGEAVRMSDLDPATRKHINEVGTRVVARYKPRL